MLQFKSQPNYVGIHHGARLANQGHNNLGLHNPRSNPIARLNHHARLYLDSHRNEYMTNSHGLVPIRNEG